MKKLFLFLSLVVFSQTVHATPGITVSVSPTTITNDYVGKISLTITPSGATGRKVLVERYLDLNNNSVIDSGEILFQSFSVTDGQLPLIGGVRNSNAPGDEDNSSNTVIHVDIPYPGVNDTLDHIAGRWIYRVFDAVQGSQATTSLLVVQKVLPQGVTGKVVSAATGLPLTNSPVVLINPNSNGGVGAICDAAGNYTLYCPPGNYVVLPMLPGVVSDQNLGFTVNSNSFTTNNLTNVVATGSANIVGRITDSATSNGLAAIFLECQNNAGLFVPTFTDTNGNFTAKTTAGSWKVKLQGESAVVQGYVRPGNNQTNVNTSSGSVSNINFQFSKATALVYGSVKDNQTNPIVALRMSGQDFNQAFDSRGSSDTNGNYSIGLLAGNSNIGPDSDAVATAGFMGTNVAVTLTDGQAFNLNFILQPAPVITAHARGHVVDNNGNPVGNIELVVSPLTTNNNDNGANSIYPTTGADGSFDVGVYAGNWTLALECVTASERNYVNSHYNFTITNGVDINNINLVVQAATAQITGTVTDYSGHAVSNITFSAGLTTNGIDYGVGCVETDSNGVYVLKVFPGSWNLQVDQFPLQALGFQLVSDQIISVSGTNTVNFVLQPTPSTLSSPQRIGSQLQFNLNGFGTRTYRIEVSSNLVNWTPYYTNTGSFFFADTNISGFPKRFYRALQLP